MDSVRKRYDDANARKWDSDLGVISEDVMFHAPGLGKDLQGRDAALNMIREFVESADVHYDVKEVVELGPFVLSLVTSSGNLDGQRKAWELLQVERYEGDEIVEMWSLRGSEPSPVSG